MSDNADQFDEFNHVVLTICEEEKLQATASVTDPRFPPPLCQFNRDKRRARFEPAATKVFEAAIAWGIPREEAEAKVVAVAKALETLLAQPWWQRFHIGEDAEKEVAAKEMDECLKRVHDARQAVYRLGLALKAASSSFRAIGEALREIDTEGKQTRMVLTELLGYNCGGPYTREGYNAVVEFFRKEYGYTSEQIGKLTDRQIYDTLVAALRRREGEASKTKPASVFTEARARQAEQRRQEEAALAIRIEHERHRGTLLESVSHVENIITNWLSNNDLEAAANALPPAFATVAASLPSLGIVGALATYEPSNDIDNVMCGALRAHLPKEHAYFPFDNSNLTMNGALPNESTPADWRGFLPICKRLDVGPSWERLANWLCRWSPGDSPKAAEEPLAFKQPVEATAEPRTNGNNVFQLDGGAWRVRYWDADESGSFTDRQDSVERRLARMLAEPNRRFRALDFYPPPPGMMAIPKLDRDESSDNRALKEEEKRLTQLVNDIKEAEAARDTEEAGKLREEFEKLTKHHDSETNARKRGHKKRCGTLPASEKADQALRVGLERLKNRLRRGGLPKLADHLDKSINYTSGDWQYSPPPGSSHWAVTLPSITSQK